MSSFSWGAVIPAYNAAGTIAEVVAGVARHLPLEAVWVVDDASTDGTAHAAQAAGARLLQRTVNGGKGCALREGFARLLEQAPDWIICLDADGQHDPGAIPEFERAADEDRGDLLVGNRLGEVSSMPLLRRFSNRSSSALLSWRTGLDLPDVQCGYRAIRNSALRRLRLTACRYDIEAEIILQAWKAGCRIGWVTIPTVYRGEPSFLRKFPETMRFLGLMARSWYDPR
jgi:glycosyltransferase involved in cell wall biosynthesis